MYNCSTQDTTSERHNILFILFFQILFVIIKIYYMFLPVYQTNDVAAQRCDKNNFLY